MALTEPFGRLETLRDTVNTTTSAYKLLQLRAKYCVRALIVLFVNDILQHSNKCRTATHAVAFQQQLGIMYTNKLP